MNDKENLFDSHNKNFFDGDTLVITFSNSLSFIKFRNFLPQNLPL